MKFGDFVKASKDETKEKHCPKVEVKTCESCPETEVIISVVKHPNTVEHHISWLQLYGVKEGGLLVHLLTADIVPVVAEACAHICIKKGEFKSLIALSYCNLHGVWENNVDL